MPKHKQGDIIKVKGVWCKVENIDKVEAPVCGHCPNEDECLTECLIGLQPYCVAVKLEPVAQVINDVKEAENECTSKSR